MKLVIQTQIQENYGAHDWNGEGECPQYWKFKGGDTYLVEDLDREQDAVAFVAALVMTNDIGYKEYPSASMTVQAWADDLPDDGGEPQSCRDYYLSQVKRVSPFTQKTKKGITEMELILI